MMHVLVRHKVADYNRWKEAFDSHLNTRKHAGETGFRLFHSADDPREMVLLLDWESVEEARKFMTSDELRTAHAEAGVVGAPEVQYLEDAAQRCTAPRPIEVRQRANLIFASQLLTPCADLALQISASRRRRDRGEMLCITLVVKLETSVFARVSRRPCSVKNLRKKNFPRARDRIFASG